MGEFWNGVGTGIGTSSVVAAIVFWLQKRDSDRTAAELGSKIDTTGDISKEALRTTLEVRDIATDLHRAVAQAQRQSAAAADVETMTQEHVAKTEAFLENAKVTGSLDLTVLHRLLLGEQLLYAGFVRDANVSVGNSTDATELLRPLPPEQLGERISAWQQAALTLISNGSESDRSFEEAVTLHIELMRIHPFFDGNGLLGRALLAAMTKQYLGEGVLIPRADPAYFTELRAAMAGTSKPLVAYLRSSEA